jgi:heme oxygenase (biliverdin-IX-beta and delta-forming)
MNGLPERLRAETHAQHQRVEAAFAFPRTREEHQRRTEVFFGFVEPLERRVQATLGEPHPLTAGRAKTGWLREDLQAQGLSEAEIAALPRCDDLPDVSTPPRALGALYVFEGATLGGQIISRHLEKELGYADGSGYRYFRSYGPEAGRRWQEFRGFLQQPAEPADADGTVAAAGETFLKLQAWMERRS